MWLPRRANCYLWAFVQRWKYGGQLVIGKSHYGWWPHVNWIDQQGVIWEYVPRGPRVRHTGLRQWLPVRALLFEGGVRRVGRICERDNYCAKCIAGCAGWLPKRRATDQ